MDIWLLGRQFYLGNMDIVFYKFEEASGNSDIDSYNLEEASWNSDIAFYEFEEASGNSDIESYNFEEASWKFVHRILSVRGSLAEFGHRFV